MLKPRRPCFCQDEAREPTCGKLSLSPVELLLLPLPEPSNQIRYKASLINHTINQQTKQRG